MIALPLLPPRWVIVDNIFTHVTMFLVIVMYFVRFTITTVVEDGLDFSCTPLPSIFQVADISPVLDISIGLMFGNFLDHLFPSSLVASSYHL